MIESQVVTKMTRTMQIERKSPAGKPLATKATGKKPAFMGIRKPMATKVARKTNSSIGRVKKARRSRPATAVLRDIKRYQKSTELSNRKMSAQHLVREVTHEHDHSMNLRSKSSSIIDFQEAAKANLKDTNMTTNHAKRVTILPRDIQLARRGEHLKLAKSTESAWKIVKRRSQYTNKKKCFKMSLPV